MQERNAKEKKRMGRPPRGTAPRQTLAVRIAPELMAEVRRLAPGRLTDAVEQALDLWVAREKKRRAATTTARQQKVRAAA